MLCMTYKSIKHQEFTYAQFNDKTVLSQAIQFCMSHCFALSLNFEHFYLAYSLSCATTPDQSRPASDGNEGMTRIPQRSRITGA